MLAGLVVLVMLLFLPGGVVSGGLVPDMLLVLPQRDLLLLPVPLPLLLCRLFAELLLDERFVRLVRGELDVMFEALDQRDAARLDSAKAALPPARLPGSSELASSSCTPFVASAAERCRRSSKCSTSVNDATAGCAATGLVRCVDICKGGRSLAATASSSALDVTAPTTLAFALAPATPTLARPLSFASK